MTSKKGSAHQEKQMSGKLGCLPPVSVFSMDDIEVEVAKLEAADAEFTRPPVKAGGAAIAVFGDTCGDFIQLIERHV